MKDIIQPIAYDNFGREKRKFLPIIPGQNTGYYNNNLLDANGNLTATALNFFNNPNDAIADDSHPFSETVFEKSPLNRVLKQGAPGAVWQPNENISTNDKSVKIEYTSNGSNEVFSWEITSLGDCKLTSNHYYAPNELYVTITKDENWSSTQTYPLAGTIREYKDKQGRVVLKRSYNINNTGNGVDTYDTYYVYDDFGNLRVVIPPEGINKLGSQLTQIDEGPNVMVVTSNLTLTGTSNKKYYYCPGVTVTLSPNFTGSTGFELAPYPLSANLMDQYLFSYKYDGLNRLIEKKVPGAQPVYMVYDARDRLVLTQDGEQRKTNNWLFTKYDALNRPVLTGQKMINSTRSIVQTDVNNYYQSNLTKFYEYRSGTSTTDDLGYSDQSYPTGLTNSNYLTATYYDNYGFISNSNLNYPGSPPSPYNGNVRLTAPKGQVTGGKVKNLKTSVWVESAMYYDKNIVRSMQHRPIT
ncbi:MAG: hypothetical protein HC819_23160 [Cyclobacteriaceae bacterium]|nr:hypothetical protein [Cyclobacteriaceae bacterium]